VTKKNKDKVDNQSKEKSKQFNISIPEDIFFAIKAYSVEKRQSLQAVGNKILADFVRKKN